MSNNENGNTCNRVPERNNWIFGEDDISLNKDELKRLYISKILIRTQRMFSYKNLPKTIPEKDLELLLQVNGSATIAKVDGKLYAFRASLGGVPNPYYLPTVAIIANPALKYNAQLEIDKDCVVILNDALYLGLMPSIKHVSSLLAECDISFKFAAVNIRIPAIIDAPNDTAKAEAEKFLQQIESGEKLGVIADDAFVDGLNVYNYANSNTSITHLIELKQYILGTFYQEIGIQSPFNMKREAINEAEAALSQDILYPLIDEMLEQRKIGLDKINAMFGTNISVELSSVWKQLRKQQDLAFKVEESEIKNNEQVKEQS